MALAGTLQRPVLDAAARLRSAPSQPASRSPSRRSPKRSPFAATPSPPDRSRRAGRRNHLHVPSLRTRPRRSIPAPPGPAPSSRCSPAFCSRSPGSAPTDYGSAGGFTLPGTPPWAFCSVCPSAASPTSASVVQTRAFGQLWLTGGDYGPEGAAFTVNRSADRNRRSGPRHARLRLALHLRSHRRSGLSHGRPSAGRPRCHGAAGKARRRAVSLVQILPTTPQTRSVSDEPKP